MIGTKQTLYEVLELNPEASPQEIREAYLRLKAAYSRDSVALYTLMDRSETEGMLRLIEEAYTVLSNPDRRKDYDRNHGLMDDEHDLDHPRPKRGRQKDASKKVISIDRVPPMDTREATEELLIAPTTDYGTARPESASAFHPDPPETPASDRAQPEAAVSFEGETEWRGSLLKKVREARRISIEEMSDFTKISKTYLRAIEDEDFSRLPAPVFLRGFVIQIARKLKLPSDQVAAAYLARYRQNVPEKH